MPGDVLIPGPTSQGSPGIRRWSALLLMQGPLPHGGGVCTRRHLVASSAAWGPCPTAAVFVPGDISSPPPQRGAPAPRRPCLCPATCLYRGRLLRVRLGSDAGRLSSSCRGPCPTAAVFVPGDISSPPPQRGAPAPRRPCLCPATCLYRGRLLRVRLGPDVGGPSSSGWGPCPSEAVVLGRSVDARRRVCTRRHLVASSAAWGPCPTAAVFVPGDILSPPPQRGAPAPRRPCSCQAWKVKLSGLFADESRTTGLPKPVLRRVPIRVSTPATSINDRLARYEPLIPLAVASGGAAYF